MSEPWFAGLRGLSKVGGRIARQFKPARKPRVVLPPNRPSSPSRNLAVTAIFKNEAAYLAEWLEFYRLIGVEHIYLYDNGSKDNPKVVLDPFIKQGFVTLTPWNLPYHTASVTAQHLAYAHAIMNFGADWRWMAFVDIDEFLFPAEGDSLSGVMQEYEDLPAIAAFWTMFGFSGHETLPAGLVIENYTMRAPFPTQTRPKSIVNPAEVVAVSSPHLFDLNCGPRCAFTETRQLYRAIEGRGPQGPKVNISLRLNHYYTRSRSEFEEKINKRDAAGGKGYKRRIIASEIEKAPIRDETVLRFVPELKARLAGAGPVGDSK